MVCLCRIIMLSIISRNSRYKNRPTFQLNSKQITQLTSLRATSMIQMMGVSWLRFLIYLTVYGRIRGEIESWESESKLLKKLFPADSMMPFIRPHVNPDEPVEVRLSATLQNIVEVDETESVLGANLWMALRWKDHRLTWDPELFSGIDKLMLPATQIWLPDISLYNSAFELDYVPHGKTHLVISSTGDISWIPPIHVRALCVFNVKSFPYDTNTCNLKFGSWTHSGQMINLTLANEVVDTSTFARHPVFDLKEAKAKRNAVRYECCPEEYIDIVLSLTLSRRSSILSLIYVAPAVCLGLLVPFIFLIQRKSYIFGIGLQACLLILLSMIEDVFPASDAHSTPMIAIYYASCFIVASICLILKFLLGVLSDSPISPPPGLARCFATLGKPLCVNPEIQYADEQPIMDEGSSPNDVEVTSPPKPSTTWRPIATIMERILFLVFLVLILIITVGYIP
ncbi:neuronal acetylcholine receptor subunit alpha-7-like [Tubulanus polymorphus]|uniref:neuronal acetylcholine receptor subunit alpha-7-like n=1 Tax=Tubulanus polymorphus TaxID=672921 RepID=UPI003DA3366A